LTDVRCNYSVKPKTALVSNPAKSLYRETNAITSFTLTKPPNGLRRDSALWVVADAGVDSAWEQKKPEARKMLEKPHHTHLPKRSEGVHVLLARLLYAFGFVGM
jgi:hypothetical protein